MYYISSIILISFKKIQLLFYGNISLFCSLDFYNYRYRYRWRVMEL